jgi:hypothetical protein
MPLPAQPPEALRPLAAWEEIEISEEQSGVLTPAANSNDLKTNYTSQSSF